VAQRNARVRPGKKADRKSLLPKKRIYHHHPEKEKKGGQGSISGQINGGKVVQDQKIPRPFGGGTEGDADQKRLDEHQKVQLCPAKKNAGIRTGEGKKENEKEDRPDKALKRKEKPSPLTRIQNSLSKKKKELESQKKKRLTTTWGVSGTISIRGGAVGVTTGGISNPARRLISRKEAGPPDRKAPIKSDQGKGEKLGGGRTA